MMSDPSKKKLTTNHGEPVENDLNSKTAGKRGPMLIQDIHFLEKLAHFDRERIPERVVHAKGAGAYGTFRVTNDVTKYTKAKFLSEVGKETELFLRFSTVGGEKGSADSDRDPRGFAVKFYTEDGNYDMVGNNTPVFFIRDPLKFPDFIHTQKRDPRTNLKNPNMFWDFLSLTPESVHQVTILFSDRGTPFGYRHMNGYSSHTFKWINEKGEYFWVKYHFKTNQGNETLTADEAGRLAGEDPDSATRDLARAIDSGEFPSWRVCVQIITPDEAETLDIDLFDVTKVVPHGKFPLIEIGEMTLNRNPENYFAETEQAAFSPGNLVPGIATSPDKMLQGRLFSYHDTHRHRVGTNHHLIPVNRAKAATTANYQRDGAMRTDDGGGAGPNYWPNSFSGTPQPDPEAGEIPFAVEGDAGRHEFDFPNDDYAQAGDLYRKVMSAVDRKHLVSNIVGHLGGAIERIQYRQAAVFYRADSEYGTEVARGLGLEEAEVARLAGLDENARAEATTEAAWQRRSKASAGA
jgi:catalase